MLLACQHSPDTACRWPLSPLFGAHQHGDCLHRLSSVFGDQAQRLAVHLRRRGSRKRHAEEEDDEDDMSGAAIRRRLAQAAEEGRRLGPTGR